MADITTLRGKLVFIDQWLNYTDLTPQWDDLRFPAQGINPLGSAAPPTIDTTTMPGTLLFSGSTDNHIAGVAQMPHSWYRGSAIKPHIHWAKTTTDSGSIAWQFRYAVASVGETFGAYSDWVDGTLSVSDSDTVGKHALTSFGSIDMTGIRESAIILWELRRDVSEDAIAADVRLFEVDFHFQANKTGTIGDIPVT